MSKNNESEQKRCERCRTPIGEAKITVEFSSPINAWICCATCRYGIHRLNKDDVDRLQQICDHDERLKLGSQMIEARGLVSKLSTWDLRFPCYDELPAAIERGKQMKALEKQINDVFRK